MTHEGHIPRPATCTVDRAGISNARWRAPNAPAAIGPHLEENVMARGKVDVDRVFDDLDRAFGPVDAASGRLARRGSVCQPDVGQFWKEHGETIKQATKIPCRFYPGKACEALKNLAKILDALCSSSVPRRSSLPRRRPGAGCVPPEGHLRALTAQGRGTSLPCNRLAPVTPAHTLPRWVAVWTRG